jgi:hypothetical protein
MESNAGIVITKKSLHAGRPQDILSAKFAKRKFRVQHADGEGALITRGIL